MRLTRWLLTYSALVVPALAWSLSGVPQANLSHPQATLSDSEQGLLWEVQSDGVRPSWLFATIHSEDPRVTTLAPPVEDALKRCDSFVMEVLMDEGALTAVGSTMAFAEGRGLRNVLPPDLYGRAVGAMADYGIPEMMVDRLKPWAVAMTLSTPRPQTGLVLDVRLLMMATQLGKPTHGLETAAEQLGVFDQLSIEDQVKFLKETLDQLPVTERLFGEVHEVYLAHDLTRLARLRQQYASRDNAQIEEGIMEELVDARNARMADRMAPYLEKGGAFIAVGALHLPGQGGILQRLRERGYRLTAVY